MSANDGGPAFPGPAYIHGRGNCQPVVFPDGSFEWQEMAPGMSLRDWFAGLALATMKERDYSSFERMAEFAYSLADAMLAASERKEDK